MEYRERLIDAKFAQHIADAELSKDNAGIVQWVLSHTPTAKTVEVQRCRYCCPNDCACLQWDCSDIGVSVTLQAAKFVVSNEFGEEAELPINNCPFCGAKIGKE